MKKYLFLGLIFGLFATAEVAAQNKQLNSTQADTLKLFLRISKSMNVAYGGNGYSVNLDTLQKVFAKQTAATAQRAQYLEVGANKMSNIATLASGVVVVSHTGVTANSRFRITLVTEGGTATGVHYVVTARTPGTSFTITSKALDKSTVTTDNSVVFWEMFNN